MASPVSVAVGIDMGATHIRICLLAAQQQVVCIHKAQTQQVLIPDVCSGLTTFIEQQLTAQHAVAGAMVIGLPSAISLDRRTVMSTPNLPGRHAEFAQMVGRLQQHFGCPVHLERDVNLQLFYDVSEQGLEQQLVIACYLGSGFGCAVWLKGAPFTGAHGVAGELGHIPYGDPQQYCGCGNPGCLETGCSGVALQRWYERTPRHYALSEVFIHAAAEPMVVQLLDAAARAIATSVNLFDPDTLILGGGLVDMAGFPWEALLTRVRLHVRKPLPEQALRIIRASSSAFGGAIGAARRCQPGTDHGQAEGGSLPGSGRMKQIATL